MDTVKEETVSTGTGPISRFIILIPHRDALKPLYEYRRRLFAAGYIGAYSFPLAAPLASVSRPFNREELKELGRNIRSINSRFFTTNDTNCVNAGLSFFGPSLNIPAEEGVFPQTARDKILRAFLPPVLCAALVGDRLPKTSRGGTEITKNNEEKTESFFKDVPALSFQAASLVNLAIRPIKTGGTLSVGEFNYSFEWVTGPPVWLPKAAKQ